MVLDASAHKTIHNIYYAPFAYGCPATYKHINIHQTKQKKMISKIKIHIQIDISFVMFQTGKMMIIKIYFYIKKIYTITIKSHLFLHIKNTQ